MNAKQTQRRSKLVPVTVGGKTFMADANSIAQSDWTHHHGHTAAGIKVNSALSCGIGESTLVKPSQGAPAVSFLNTDLEVLATQTLSAAGFKIQAPQAAA